MVRIELDELAEKTIGAEDSIASALEFVQASFGRLDILINNAAVCFNDDTLYGTVAAQCVHKHLYPITLLTPNPEP